MLYWILLNAVGIGSEKKMNETERSTRGMGGECFWGQNIANSPWVKNKTTFYLKLVGLHWSVVHSGYEHETLPSYVSSLHYIFLHKKLSRTSSDLCGEGLLLGGHIVHSVPCWSHPQTHHWMPRHYLMGFQLRNNKANQHFQSTLISPLIQVHRWVMTKGEGTTVMPVHYKIICTHPQNRLPSPHLHFHNFGRH